MAILQKIIKLTTYSFVLLSLTFQAEAKAIISLNSSTIEPNNLKLGTSIFLARKVPRVRIAPNRISAILSNFRTRTVKIGSKKFVIGPNDMRHILERHHPRYWAGPKPVKRQTFLNENMTVDEIADAVEAIARQKRTELSSLGSNGGQVEGLFNGVRYVLGVDRRGRIRQFFPKGD